MFQSESLGIQENQLNIITLYPNPANNTITVTAQGQGIEDISIVDIRGRRLLDLKTNGQQSQTLNIETLQSAVYLVNITTEIGTVTKRLIKQ